ncbi:putative reverse transcriptase domain-containing protein [Tanacetum coccineum]|uniref:Reverse transcriptase domain-containing protein n=1 Tax=Tanacetum coccineum TaxID=301880 RepID=A0ABQ4Z0G5_9ASTR
MFRGTPIISAGFQAKISKFCLSKTYSSLRSFFVNVDPMAIVCSGYSGWIAIRIFSSNTWLAVGDCMLGPKIIAHSIGMTQLLCSVTVPPSTGNFNIPCAVDGMARIFLMPGLPIIALCCDGDLIIMKFIHAKVEYERWCSTASNLSYSPPPPLLQASLDSCSRVHFPLTLATDVMLADCKAHQVPLGHNIFSRIMPPRRFKKKSVRKIVEKRVAKAIEKYEKTRADSNNTGGSGSTNTGGTVVPEMHGCSYKTFMNGKPHSFKGTEGVVGLKRWFEKMEQVFEICKCAEDDKVKFAMCTFEGRALTWWNGNVQTLGLANANQIPWSNVKAMMTTEYCPATEIQRMEQELWTLTLKGDDIEAYSNRFHELVLMCPELVSTESKKIEKYIRGFPERIKGNITSSKPETLHEAINMACKLVEQLVQGRAARIGESNKRKWEDNQRNNNNNNHNYNNNRNRNNNHHQQQNRRQEDVRAYAAAPTRGKIYAGNLPKCNDFLQNVRCFGCGEKGHFKDKCPKARNQQNNGARGRAYVVVENPQQNPNVVTGTFLLNDHYACILFDSGAEKSFFLGHVVNHDGIHVDPSKVESVKNWKTPESDNPIESIS